jgi:hydrogenase maturation protease
MSKIMVIGYGNPLRSDDSFGWRATEELQHAISMKGVEFVECQQLAPELAQKIAEKDLVIFIDADSNGVAGQIHCYPVRPAKPGNNSVMTHHLDPCALLSLANELYNRVPEAMVVSVTGECFGYGKQLSTPVASSLPGVVRHLTHVIEEHAGELVNA